MNEPQKFALIKLDKVRGNACVSRREIISSFKKEYKAKIIEKYKIGDIIKGAEVKGYSSFGCFFNVNNELDVLVHLQEISYSRVNHPDEVFNIGENTGILKQKLRSSGFRYTTIPPTVIKKEATGKGNANKELMYETFLAETNVDLQSQLTPNSTKIVNPVSDIVDSYYICKTGFQ